MYLKSETKKMSVHIFYTSINFLILAGFKVKYLFLFPSQPTGNPLVSGWGTPLTLLTSSMDSPLNPVEYIQPV